MQSFICRKHFGTHILLIFMLMLTLLTTFSVKTDFFSLVKLTALH